MDSQVSRLSWMASTAKQAIDDIHELSDLPFAIASLVTFASLALICAGSRGANVQITKASNQILSGLVRELTAQARNLQPPSTKGSGMPSTVSPTTALQQAAYMASDAIDAIHDLTSFGTAGRAMVYMAEILVQTSVDDLAIARTEDPRIPGLTSLFDRWKAAGQELSAAATS